LTLHLGRRLLASEPQPARNDLVRTPQYHGLAMGEWMGMGIVGDRPGDQRLDDGFAVLYETEPLTERLEVLGAPMFEALLASDKPEAHLVVRLSDVSPDGAATRVSYGVLNLAHRDSHEFPSPLPVGDMIRVRLQLNDCGHAFPAGHRIRLSVATTCWPLIWPVKEAATLTLAAGDSLLQLPRRTPRVTDEAVCFEPPAHGPLTPREVVSAGEIKRSFFLDLITDAATYITSGEGGVFGEGIIRFPEIDTTVGHSLARKLTIKGDDPLSATFSLTQSIDLGREGWQIRIETDTAMSSTGDTYRLTGEVRTFANGVPFVTRSFDETVPRAL
jgi:hypothetical protein